MTTSTLQELEPWAAKVTNLAEDPDLRTIRIYFNNHYGAAAVENALEFRQMIGETLEQNGLQAIDRARRVFSAAKSQKKIVQFDGARAKP